ncbi:MAG: putative transposase [Bradyrhizobium sp.]|nr:putative transposase [Bradyrhizobium sp.]
MVLVKPATVIQWHRKGFRLYWRWRSRSDHPGRPKTPRETRDLIRKMSIANPLWGAPRIHGELLKLGIVVSQATVGRYMPWRPAVPSPTWRSFLRNHMGDTAAIDMFVVATATFRLLYTVIVLGHDRRRIIHFDVTQNPTQVWLAHQMTEAFPWDTAPRYVLRDRDASYGQVFRNRLQAMGIKEIVSAARSPWQNAYVERIIGSVRRECSVTSSSSVNVTCAVCCRPTFTITTKRERISRSTRIVRRAARYTHSVPARSSRSRRSAVCIIATSVARLNLLSRP